MVDIGTIVSSIKSFLLKRKCGSDESSGSENKYVQ